jgi:exopolyphosphatase / guanosine-5'-triphosphate,3'-diphosphate pyrophosphatase
VKGLAVIDIGSNTLLLTVGRLTPQKKLEILLDQGDVVRLSEGLKDGGALQPEAKTRTLETLRQFQKLAVDHGANNILAAGTAAFRRACDGQAFATEIKEKLNIPVRILSGDEEAHYSYLSAKFDFEKEYGNVGMIDIGGGSTEFVFGEKGPRLSLPVGTVRLTEGFIHHHPIPDAEWFLLRAEIRNILKKQLVLPAHSPSTWVAVAATPASLAAVLLQLPHYQPDRIHGYHMKIDSLNELVERLRTLSIEERISMPGMHPKRAELLPIGGAILAEAMKFLNLEEILVSDHGLRYGLLTESLGLLA